MAMVNRLEHILGGGGGISERLLSDLLVQLNDGMP